MAVTHMKRSEGRGTDFPTECGAVGDKLLIATTWDKVTCNNCIRKFGPDTAKKEYVAQAKDRGVKTPDVIKEEKSEDQARMSLEALLNGIRSQQLRMEGIKISLQAVMDPISLVDDEALGELLMCVEYLEAALANLVIVKGMVFTKLHGHTVEEEHADEKVS